MLSNCTMDGQINLFKHFCIFYFIDHCFWIIIEFMTFFIEVEEVLYCIIIKSYWIRSKYCLEYTSGLFIVCLINCVGFNRAYGFSSSTDSIDTGILSIDVSSSTNALSWLAGASFFAVSSSTTGFPSSCAVSSLTAAFSSSFAVS